MSKQIPAEKLVLFEKPAFGHLATIMPDGSPQVSPVWIGYDGQYVIVNSAQGRQKDRNIRRDKRVAVEVQDPDNPYNYVLIRGRVVEITTDGAEEGIDALAVKYTGDVYKNRVPGQVRVIYKIEPEHVGP
jgi:PPOX class probable F420-dependent enzyme